MAVDLRSVGLVFKFFFKHFALPTHIAIVEHMPALFAYLYNESF